MPNDLKVRKKLSFDGLMLDSLERQRILDDECIERIIAANKKGTGMAGHFEVLHWLNTQMNCIKYNELFKSVSISHNLENLQKKGCTFIFEPNSAIRIKNCGIHNAMLSLKISPEFGMYDITINHDEGWIKFDTLIDALDWFSGYLALYNIDDAYYEDYFYNEEELEKIEQEKRDAYEVEQARNLAKGK